jgi:hypothetical protein
LIQFLEGSYHMGADMARKYLVLASIDFDLAGTVGYIDPGH